MLLTNIFFLGCEQPPHQLVTPKTPPSELMLSDSNSVQIVSSIALDSQLLQAGADAWISWTELSVDMLGHSYDPATVDQATLVVFRESEKEELEQSIANNQIDQSTVRLLVNCTPEEMGCWLSSFTMLGTDIDIEERFQPEEGLWLLALSTLESSVSYQRLMLIEPDLESEKNEVFFDDEKGLFEAQVDFEAAEELLVPLAGTVTFDWSELAKDSQGNDIPLHRIDRLELAFYENRSPQELEEEVLNLDLISTQTWSLDVEGIQSASTDLFEGFSGFNGTGSWILALRCMTCGAAVPMFLGRVVPQ